MIKQVAAGGGVAIVLGAGVLIGGMTTGLAGAHQAHQATVSQTQPATPAPAADVQNGAEAPGTENNDAEANDVATLPAGSISSTDAQTAASSYVQQTAPFNGEGLTFQDVHIDNENGTTVYTVTFAGNAGEVEVQVSPAGKVLGADTGSQSNGQSENANGQGEQSDTGGQDGSSVEQAD